MPLDVDNFWALILLLPLLLLLVLFVYRVAKKTWCLLAFHARRSKQTKFSVAQRRQSSSKDSHVKVDRSSAVFSLFTARHAATLHLQHAVLWVFGSGVLLGKI